MFESFPSFSYKMFPDMSNISTAGDRSVHSENAYLRECLEKERYRRKVCGIAFCILFLLCFSFVHPYINSFDWLIDWLIFFVLLILLISSSPSHSSGLLLCSSLTPTQPQPLPWALDVCVNVYYYYYVLKHTIGSMFQHCEQQIQNLNAKVRGC